jgi:hypothetical protein
MSNDDLMWNILSLFHQLIKPEISLKKEDKDMRHLLLYYESKLDTVSEWHGQRRDTWLHNVLEKELSPQHFATCIFALEQHLSDQARNPEQNRITFFMKCTEASFDFMFPSEDHEIHRAMMWSLLAALNSGIKGKSFAEDPNLLRKACIESKRNMFTALLRFEQCIGLRALSLDWILQKRNQWLEETRKYEPHHWSLQHFATCIFALSQNIESDAFNDGWSMLKPFFDQSCEESS